MQQAMLAILRGLGIIALVENASTHQISLDKVPGVRE